MKAKVKEIKKRKGVKGMDEEIDSGDNDEEIEFEDAQN